MAGIGQVVYSILEFLEDQIKSGTLGEEAAESIEVATQCLETAYGINTRDDGSMRPDRSLIEIFSTVYGTQNTGVSTDPHLEPDIARPAAPDVCSATPANGAQPSEEDKQKAEDFKNQGNELMKRERYGEAVECYNKSVSIDSTNAVYYSNRAAAFSKLENHKKALEDCDRAIKIDPNYSKAYGRMGLAYTHLNDLRRAKDAYARAVELEPGNDSYQTNLRIAEKKLKDANLGGGGGGGMPNLGQGLGGMDLGSFLNNPALMNAASSLLQNPQMQNMMSSMMGQAMQPEEGQNPDQQASMANLLQVGQQMASQIQQQNPDLVQQIQGLRNRQNQPGGGGRGSGGPGSQSQEGPDPPAS
ncbi:small glutamine-rich tetratricopeptide repeat-containing protein alpha-like [Patiria miniata]|uniref:SGTA homodimerisation domain-containing protein n=1 Tax=Patiria miniata TaxID=46514 RepID=A0A913ZBE0_PATMI|nr:small glutamine-rich tetratricopeptide repeat-containing protein alpha-like [Patiria miniata]XP_038048347.1 small glutamine-rich tetratricopeptide repeat-containing protein alpha-like [Patiria miniata]